MTKWRLEAFKFQKMVEPDWSNVKYKSQITKNFMLFLQKKPKYNSLEEVDPELLKTFDKLGIPIDEQKKLSGVSRYCYGFSFSCNHF